VWGHSVVESVRMGKVIGWCLMEGGGGGLDGEREVWRLGWVEDLMEEGGSARHSEG